MTIKVSDWRCAACGRPPGHAVSLFCACCNRLLIRPDWLYLLVLIAFLLVAGAVFEYTHNKLYVVFLSHFIVALITSLTVRHIPNASVRAFLWLSIAAVATSISALSIVLSAPFSLSSLAVLGAVLGYLIVVYVRSWYLACNRLHLRQIEYLSVLSLGSYLIVRCISYFPLKRIPGFDNVLDDRTHEMVTGIWNMIGASASLREILIYSTIVLLLIVALLRNVRSGQSKSSRLFRSYVSFAGLNLLPGQGVLVTIGRLLILATDSFLRVLFFAVVMFQRVIDYVWIMIVASAKFLWGYVMHVWNLTRDHLRLFAKMMLLLVQLYLLQIAMAFSVSLFTLRVAENVIAGIGGDWNFAMTALNSITLVGSQVLFTHSILRFWERQLAESLVRTASLVACILALSLLIAA